MTAQYTMMTFGEFKFSMATAAYDELQQTSSYTYAEQEVIGGEPKLQFTGKAVETISLQGVVFPGAWYAEDGLYQVSKLRNMAETGQDFALVSGTGTSFGTWVIDKITETTTVHFGDGTPRKIAFTLNLKRYSKRREPQSR